MNKCNAAVSSANRILDSIDRDLMWKWAANVENRDNLKTLKDTAESGLNQFGRQLLVEQPQVMKKRVKGSDKQHVELDAFMLAATAFDVLAAKNTKLLKMHSILCEDEDTESQAKKQKVGKV